MTFRAIQDFFRSLPHFAQHGIWEVELTSLGGPRRLGIKCIRIVAMVLKGFRDDDCPLHASALTFISLMALVPVLALSLAFLGGLGARDFAMDKLRGMVNEIAGQVDGETTMAAGAGATNAAIQVDGATNGLSVATATTSPTTTVELVAKMNDGLARVEEFVDNINFYSLGGVGLVILMITVVSLLGRIELSFNRVWGVAAGRGMVRKLFDYMGMMVILPMLLIGATSLQIVDLADRHLTSSLSVVVQAMINSAVYKDVVALLMVCAALTLVLIFVPNTTVRVAPAALGGLIGGGLLLWWMRICVGSGVSVMRYQPIYGAFAMLPIVLAWVHVGWQIVLLGAEVAFAAQNCTTYQMEGKAPAASVRSKLVLALAAIGQMAEGMLGAGRPFEPAAFARDRQIPIRLVNEIMDGFVGAGLAARLEGGSEQFALLKTPETIRVDDVLNVFIQSGTAPAELGLRCLGPDVASVLERVDAGIADSVGDLSVHDMIAHGDVRLADLPPPPSVANG